MFIKKESADLGVCARAHAQTHTQFIFRASYKCSGPVDIQDFSVIHTDPDPDPDPRGQRSEWHPVPFHTYFHGVSRLG